MPEGLGTFEPEQRSYDEPLLTHLLIRRGLVDRRRIVDGSLAVLPAHSRNANFIVTSTADGLFIKQAEGNLDLTGPSVRREAELLRLVQDHEELAALRPHVPAVVDYLPRDNLLITRLVEGETLFQHIRTGKVEAAAARAYGAALATLHATSANGQRLVTESGVARHAKPWFLSIHSADGADEFRGLAGEIRRLVMDHDIAKHLDSVAAAWQADRLIHGDIKSENVIVAGEQVVLTDWEAVDIGDAAWDVAGAFQSFLAMWVESMPREDTAPTRLVTGAGLDLDSLQELVREFWTGYSEGATDDGSLRRIAQFIAARCVQSSAEHSADELSREGALLLQMALNIFEDPDGALRDLLGIAA